MSTAERQLRELHKRYTYVLLRRTISGDEYVLAARNPERCLGVVETAPTAAKAIERVWRR